jgi:hypothetical protein
MLKLIEGLPVKKLMGTYFHQIVFYRILITL